jgi:hypothetical protein
MYSDRAMLVSSLAWIALAGWGLSRMPRRIGVMALVLMAGLNLAALQRYFNDPASRRVDYLPAWKFVQENWRPGDAVFHRDLYCYYPFKFYALQESHRTGTLKPNWVFAEPPVFPAESSPGFFRGTWRKVNSWLGSRGMGIYTGYNRDFVGTDRIQAEALPGVARIWYLNTASSAAPRLWMPQINVYRSGYSPWVPFEPETLPWLQKDFHPTGHERRGDADIYCFERNAPPGGRTNP